MATGSRRHFPGPPDSDTFRILISTDNHAGYAEGDPLRREDSFRTLEEIFIIAKDNDVDFVLIGGDLYHFNTPSRYSHWRVAEIFKTYCLGRSNVEFEVAEDSLILFPDGKLNYHDQTLSISLPVFAIHGNHDDPSGTPALSAMDLLHQCRMLNYFGKFATADELVVPPLKMRKGNTHLSIYGFGNIRDERLRQTIDRHKLTWIKDEDTDDIVNLAIVHQNRYNRGSANSFMPEQAFPTFLDAIVWCHEHECIRENQTSATGASILQPGSSVATSLSESEVPEKHVAIMEIKGKGQGSSISLTMIPLQTVRPFELQDVVLSLNGLPPGDTCTEQQVMNFLERSIEEMITKANQKYISRGNVGPLPLSDAIMQESRNFSDAGAQTSTNASGGMRDGRPLPLIRLRVDASGGYPKPASIKFAPKFEGRVANPESLVIYLRRSTMVGAKSTAKREASDQKTADEKLGQLSGDDERAIFSLIHEELGKYGGLRAVSESVMAEALRDFAEKGAQTMSTALKTYGDRLIDFVHHWASPTEVFAATSGESKKTYELVGRYAPVDDETIRKLSHSFAESLETGKPARIPALQAPQEVITPVPAMPMPMTQALPVSQSNHQMGNMMALSQTSLNTNTESTVPAKRKSLGSTGEAAAEAPRTKPATARGARVKQEAAPVMVKKESSILAGTWGQEQKPKGGSQLLTTKVPMHTQAKDDDDDDDIIVDRVITNPRNAPTLSKTPALPLQTPFSMLSTVKDELKAHTRGHSQLALQRTSSHTHSHSHSHSHSHTSHGNCSSTIEIPDEGDDGDSLMAGLSEAGAQRVQMYRAKGCAHDVPLLPSRGGSITPQFAATNRGYSGVQFDEAKQMLQQQFRGGQAAPIRSDRLSALPNRPGISQMNPLLMPTQSSRTADDMDEL